MSERWRKELEDNLKCKIESEKVEEEWKKEWFVKSVSKRNSKIEEKELGSNDSMSLKCVKWLREKMVNCIKIITYLSMLRS